MKKKLFMSIIFTIYGLVTTYANTPPINCVGLPGCDSTDISNPESGGNIGIPFISSLTGYTIQFVAIISVVALVISGIMYLLSGGEEEKTKKAKSWIIWSLVAVFLSISAWSIINILNNLKIN